MKIFGFNFHVSRAASSGPQPAAGVQQKSASDWIGAWLTGRDVETGGAVLSNAYQQVVWVYRAINVLAEQVANIPFRFSTGERGGEQLIASGPLVDFYARPHPQINRFQYWELRIIWLMLRGECFRIPIYETGQSKLKIKNPKLKTLLLLDPAHFQHIVEDHQLIGWRYTGFSNQAPLAAQVFLPEEVWFEKLANPFDFWRGMPPLQVAALAAKTDFAASAFMKGFMENNADTGLVVRTPQPLDETQREQILAALRERKRKAGTADRPLLLSGGAEVIKPQLSSSDLQFLENRKFSRGEICAAFGVPEEIVATTDIAKYDVMSGARLNFIENRVAPLCGRLEAEEDRTVKSLDPRATGWFDLDSLPILQQARRSRLTTAKTGFDMGVPFNELNRVLDLGFKPLPWGDIGYLPARLQAAGRSQDTGDRRQDTGDSPDGSGFRKLKSQEPGGRRQETGDGRQETGDASPVSSDGSLQAGVAGWDALERVGKLLGELESQDELTHAEGAVPAATGSAGVPAGVCQPNSADFELAQSVPIRIRNVSPTGSPPVADQLASIRRKTSRLRKYFFEQRSRVLARLPAALQSQRAAPLSAKPLPEQGQAANPEQSPAPVQPACSGLAQTRRAVLPLPGGEGRGEGEPNLIHQTLAVINGLLDQTAEHEALLGELTPLLVADLELGAAQARPERDPGQSTLPAAAATDYVAARAETLKAINQATFEALTQALQPGLAAGEAPDQLAQRVKAFYNETSPRRAQTIALVETRAALARGRSDSPKSQVSSLKSGNSPQSTVRSPQSTVHSPRFPTHSVNPPK